MSVSFPSFLKNLVSVPFWFVMYRTTSPQNVTSLTSIANDYKIIICTIKVIVDKVTAVQINPLVKFNFFLSDHAIDASLTISISVISMLFVGSPYLNTVSPYFNMVLAYLRRLNTILIVLIYIKNSLNSL